jgi:hypothetical protein
MNTKHSFRLVEILLLALAAAIFCPAVASAQLAAAHASFSLPFEVHWGKAVLSPGQYTLTLNTASANGVVSIRGNDQTAILSAQGFSDKDSSGRSSLVLVRSGGIYTVRALDLGTLGVFYYWPPKGEIVLAHNAKGNERAIAQAPVLIQRLPVSVSGK